MTTPTLYVFKLKSGKLNKYLNFINDLCNNKQDDYREILLRYGLNDVRLWHQNIDDDDYAMFIHNQDDDASKKLKLWNTTGDKFEEFFGEVLGDCYVDFRAEQPKFVNAFDAKS